MSGKHHEHRAVRGRCALCATPWPCEAEQELQRARLSAIRGGSILDEMLSSLQLPSLVAGGLAREYGELDEEYRDRLLDDYRRWARPQWTRYAITETALGVSKWVRRVELIEGEAGSYKVQLRPRWLFRIPVPRRVRRQVDAAVRVQMPVHCELEVVR